MTQPNQNTLDPNRDMFEEIMQPYLENIKEVGDIIYF